MGNSTCPVPQKLPTDPVPFFSNGNINFKAHDVGWLVAGIFTIVAICASIWLILKHLRFFYSPSQQRHIVRILFMPPIYAVTSFLSYFYYNQALYFQLLRDCYEALVIASFFHLLLSYLSSPPPTSDDPCPQPYATREQRSEALHEAFRDLKVGKWVFPLGSVKWRPAGGGPGEGEGFLWLMRIGIGQYVILRPVSTLMAVVSQALGYYCLESWSPRFMHIYTSGIVSISVTIAMYCVLQLYFPLKEQLKPYRPVIKFLSVKSVVFLTFWRRPSFWTCVDSSTHYSSCSTEESVLGLFQTMGLIKDHQYWTAAEIVVGLAALLECFEMMLFAFIHISAFTYLPYRALAAEIPPPGTSDATEPLIVPKSFDDWAQLEKDKAREAVLESRLLPLPSSDYYLTHPYRKPDGQPPLRQTRKLPALWKCLRITDVFRELGEEAKFVVAKKKVDNRVDRTEAMAEVFGQSRLKASRRNLASEGDIGEKEVISLEERLKRIREDGEVLPPPDTPVTWPNLDRPSGAPRPREFSTPTPPPSRQIQSQRNLEVNTPFLKDPTTSHRKKEERTGWWNSIKSNVLGVPPTKVDDGFEEFIGARQTASTTRPSSFNPPPRESTFIPPSQRVAQGNQSSIVHNPARTRRISRQTIQTTPLTLPPSAEDQDEAALEEMPAMLDEFGNMNIPPPHRFSDVASLHPSSRNGSPPRRHSHTTSIQAPSFAPPPAAFRHDSSFYHPPPPVLAPTNSEWDFSSPYKDPIRTVVVPPISSGFGQTQRWIDSTNQFGQTRGRLPLGARPPTSAPSSKSSGSRGFVFEEY